MTTLTEIANMTLSHLGAGVEIGNIDSDKTPEAKAIRRFIYEVRDATLRDFHWPFATKIAALAEVEEDPNDEWNYSYRVPSDCVAARRILSGHRNDSRETMIPYRIAQDSSGLLIYTDRSEAELEYTLRATTTALYPPDFILAFSLRLAVYIVPRLSGSEGMARLGQRALALYQFEIQRAQATAVAEERAENQPPSALESARE